jgi:hypothetical protein
LFAGLDYSISQFLILYGSTTFVVLCAKHLEPLTTVRALNPFRIHDFKLYIDVNVFHLAHMGLSHFYRPNAVVA